MKHTHMRLERISSGRGKKKIVAKFFFCLGITLFSVVVFLFGALVIICKGPSPAAREQFVKAALNYEATEKLPSMLLSEEELAGIMQNLAIG